MKNLTIALIIIWLSVTGCSGLAEPEYSDNSVMDGEEVMLSHIDTSDVVTLEDLLIVDRKMEQIISRSMARSIHDVKSIKGEDGRILLYVINYKDNGGFSVFSGLKECEPLLAYSDEGYFDLDSIEKSGVFGWMEDLKQYIAKSDELEDSVKFRNRFEWSRLLGLSERMSSGKSRSVDLNDYKRQIEKELMEFSRQGYTIYPLSEFMTESSNSPIPSVVVPPEYLVRQISNISNKEVIEDSYVIYKTSSRESDSSKHKLMSTKWGQESPYNKFVPHYVWFEEPQLGCTAVATGQILAYKRYLSGYNYDRMFAVNPDTDEIARFLCDVGVQIGIPYTSGVYGASIYDVAQALTKWGLTYNHYKTFNKVQINSSIDSRIPVYIRAGRNGQIDGHAWVIDGYNHVVAESDCKVLLLNQYGEDVIGESIFWCYDQSTSVLYERDYYHCNWGESGQNNGFFMHGQFSCSVGELNEGIQILTNIRKR